jgi:hypothetical protein
MRLVHLQVPVWQRKVEHILMAAYSFLPGLLVRADGSERGVMYNGYRILIEQVVVLATRELNPGVVAFGVHSQAIHHVHAQRDLHDLLTHHSVGAGAFANPAGPHQAPLQSNFVDSTDFHHCITTGGNLRKFVESNDSTADPTSFRDMAESNDPTTRYHQIPPDPTRSHQIPPYPTNIMRLAV